MNRIILALALMASTSGVAISTSAMAAGYYKDNTNYQNSQYTQQQQHMRSHRHGYANDSRMQSDAQYSANAACINYGWMDNSQLQKWRAKHPGQDVCFSDATYDQNSIHRTQIR